MQNKFTEFSLWDKKYVLALVIVTMLTLQNTLSIFNLKTLSAKNILWNWGVGASHTLYGVLFKDLQRLDFDNSVVTYKAIRGTWGSPIILLNELCANLHPQI